MKNTFKTATLQPKQATTKQLDPYQRFEETKIINFQHSSRLEGIEPVIVTESLSAVLAKYKRG